MPSVNVSRTIDAPPAAVRRAIHDVESFMDAAGFDTVSVEGETIRVANQVGLAEIELILKLIEDDQSALAYEQRDGIFEEMRTRYTVESDPAGSTVTATTRFALNIALVGDILDATVIKRQRRRELDAQLTWLAKRLEDEASPVTA